MVLRQRDFQARGSGKSSGGSVLAVFLFRTVGLGTGLPDFGAFGAVSEPLGAEIGGCSLDRVTRRRVLGFSATGSVMGAGFDGSGVGVGGWTMATATGSGWRGAGEGDTGGCGAGVASIWV